MAPQLVMVAPPMIGVDGATRGSVNITVISVARAGFPWSAVVGER